MTTMTLALGGCDEPDDPAPEPELQTEAVCPDGAPAYDVYLQPRLTETGPSSNALAATDRSLWLVESDANTVSRFDRLDDSFAAGFVNLGTEKNPYGLAVDDTGGRLWVTNLLADTVSIADTDSGDILDELDADFADPSPVALTDDYAYVGNVDFRGLDDGYGDGFVTVIDRSDRQVVSTIELDYKNPEFLVVEEIDGRQVLLVSSAGALFQDDGEFVVTSEGGLEWLDIEDAPLDPDHQSYPIGQLDRDRVGAPNRPLMTPDGNQLYFTSGLAPVVFVFDVDDRQWRHDAADPLQLYDTDGETLHHGAIDPAGLLWVTAFNDDQLYLLDTACDQLVAPAIEVGDVDDLLEGPHAVVTDGDVDSIEGHYLLSIANALGRLRLEQPPDH